MGTLALSGTGAAPDLAACPTCLAGSAGSSTSVPVVHSAQPAPQHREQTGVRAVLLTVCLVCQRELPAWGRGNVSPMSIHLMTQLCIVINDSDES
jgi:hypothetical protein